LHEKGPRRRQQLEETDNAIIGPENEASQKLGLRCQRSKADVGDAVSDDCAALTKARKPWSSCSFSCQRSAEGLDPPHEQESSMDRSKIGKELRANPVKLLDSKVTLEQF